jgi:hypothetical protein
MSYNPDPPRVWSRVQNQCTYIQPGSNYNEVYIPLSGQTVTQAQANYEEKLYHKGNILQYKANSATLTKNQRYSQIAKGGGPNRKKCFATQSQTYSNPNTTGLLWTNYITLPFPNQLVGQPNNISGPFQYNVASPFGCSSTSVKEGGNLVCGSYANQCTGEIIKTTPTSDIICNPSSCSDVPGNPIELCWSNKLQTYYPRQNYSMNNSSNKWPQNYKLFTSAAKPNAPVLSLDSNTSSSVTLSWTYKSNECLPISSFNVYQNGSIVSVLPYTTTSITLDVTTGTYNYYVTSISTTTESSASNTVSVTI